MSDERSKCPTCGLLYGEGLNCATCTAVRDGWDATAPAADTGGGGRLDPVAAVLAVECPNFRIGLHPCRGCEGGSCGTNSLAYVYCEVRIRRALTPPPLPSDTRGRHEICPNSKWWSGDPADWYCSPKCAASGYHIREAPTPNTSPPAHAPWCGKPGTPSDGRRQATPAWLVDGRYYCTPTCATSPPAMKPGARCTREVHEHVWSESAEYWWAVTTRPNQARCSYVEGRAASGGFESENPGNVNDSATATASSHVEPASPLPTEPMRDSCGYPKKDPP